MTDGEKFEEEMLARLDAYPVAPEVPRMSNGERMVWAAAYAASFAASNRGTGELTRASYAVTDAEYALGALKRYEEEIGPGNHGYETVCIMLGMPVREPDYDDG